MIVLELSVDPEDMGRVIGKGGQVANAMRTLLHTSAAKEGKRVDLEIINAKPHRRLASASPVVTLPILQTH